MKILKFLLPAALLLLASCRSYSELPLDPDKVHRAIIAQQSELKVDSGFSLKAAAALLDNHPELQLIRDEYKTFEKLAAIKTPLPNPQISAGLSKGFDLGSTDASSLQPFLSIAFALPLSRRLELQDEVNGLEKEEKWTAAVLRHRSMLIDLRRAYLNVSLAQQRLRAGEQRRAYLQGLLADARKLVESGHYGELDTGRLELELQQTRLEQLDRKSLLNTARSELSARLNRVLPKDALALEKALPMTPGSEKQLRETMWRSNPATASLQRRYAIAEKELELEVERQYPDLTGGFDFEGDPGEDKKVFGLSLGIELPLFDRNHRAIEQALGKRRQIRLLYTAEASRLNLELDAALSKSALAAEKLALHRDALLPKAQKNLANARQALENGVISLQRYWDFQQQLLDLQLLGSELEIEKTQALMQIEKLTFQPLFKFPSLNSAKENSK